MKLTIVVLFACVAVALGRQVVPILTQEEVRDDFGQFSLRYATGNGIARTEQGSFKRTADGRAILVQRGAYSYIGDDGITYTVNYIADENGFQVVGDHLPQPVIA
ncbi:endocuticle structural glycoprotein ABD-5-like [Culicoides brevitarsis]|uniref:endocuticle structural glycoprotein ABD-5-like n=1 Tax=Culicoides brevitarsis TaxID=469753 RepID=UPI00307B2E57